jgi:kynurenine formamidase
MCAPTIIASVKEEFSRRGFVAALAGAAVGALGSSDALAQRAQTKPVRLAQGFRDVLDLTHTFSPRLPIFPAFKPVKITPKFAHGKDGFFANEVTFDEHTGTHMDAPVHFVANAMTADRIPPDTLIAPLCLVSIVAKASKNADATLEVDDILAWEQQHGRLPRGAFVAMHSGWDARVATPDRFLNKDTKGTMHAPGFSEAAARFLTKERDIVGAGVDTLSLDIGAAEKFVAHLALLGAGKYAVELMANLGTLPATGATLIVGAPKHEGASGGPVRVLAVR